MKTYTVWYYVKHHGTETLESMDVTAANAKEACVTCKTQYKAQTGRNAFRPSTKQPKI